MIKNLEQCFYNCDYADDFEAIINVRDVIDFEPYSGYSLWLKAYDTSCGENERERKLYEDGYGYELCVWLMNDNYNNNADYDMLMFNWAAKDKEEAMETFKYILEYNKLLSKKIDKRIMLG